ncbi:IS256 family transposase, partial [Yersinia similis]
DRENTFEPQLIKKNQTRITQMDSQILSLYAKGMTTREIVATFKEMYDADVSPTLISKVTDAVKEQVAEWQNRQLDALYPIVYMDCIVVKVRQNGSVINKAVFLALGINTEGQKELLGMWLAENEGAKFWLSVLTELKNRGLQDILIACVDGLKGFPDAINSVSPQTHIQLCIIHMVRNSLKYVSWKDYKAVTSGLKMVYQAPTEEAALMALDKFEEAWDDKYPQISKSWRTHWENLNTFFGYPPDIRKAIYTTNAIESVNSVIRAAIKKRKVFPTDDSVRKVVYLAIKDASKKWSMPIQNWRLAMSRFIIEFGDRLSDHL